MRDSFGRVFAFFFFGDFKPMLSTFRQYFTGIEKKNINKSLIGEEDERSRSKITEFVELSFEIRFSHIKINTTESINLKRKVV